MCSSSAILEPDFDCGSLTELLKDVILLASLTPGLDISSIKLLPPIGPGSNALSRAASQELLCSSMPTSAAEGSPPSMSTDGTMVWLGVCSAGCGCCTSEDTDGGSAHCNILPSTAPQSDLLLLSASVVKDCSSELSDKRASVTASPAWMSLSSIRSCPRSEASDTSLSDVNTSWYSDAVADGVSSTSATLKPQ